jgi:glutathione S-transferase
MKLHDLKAGTNPRRLRIFLAEKGISLPTVQVDMNSGENRQPAYLALNPLGTMPTLELDDGTVLTESIAICRYFEELQPEPPLFGTSALERAQVEMWNRRLELELQTPIQHAFVHLSPFWQGRRPQVSAYGEVARARALEVMRLLDAEIGSRPFFVGPRYTVADITAQCALLLGKHTGTVIPPELGNLARWFAEVSARPSARA